MAGSTEVTVLLERWNDGNDDVQEELLPIVYEELRRMARRHLRKQRAGHTFQTTELIHEAYLKLAVGKQRDWKSRNHFFGVAATAMRHILVDHARAKMSKKRGGSAKRVDFEETAAVYSQDSGSVVALDECLKALGEVDDRKAKVVELKFFGGLKVEEIASFLGVSEKTVKRDWQFSRAWLLNKLSQS